MEVSLGDKPFYGLSSYFILDVNLITRTFILMNSKIKKTWCLHGFVRLLKDEIFP